MTHPHAAAADADTSSPCRANSFEKADAAPAHARFSEVSSFRSRSGGLFVSQNFLEADRKALVNEETTLLVLKTAGADQAIVHRVTVCKVKSDQAITFGR